MPCRVVSSGPGARDCSTLATGPTGGWKTEVGGSSPEIGWCTALPCACHAPEGGPTLDPALRHCEATAPLLALVGWCAALVPPSSERAGCASPSIHASMEPGVPAGDLSVRDLQWTK
ncbi:hypothetical protein AcV5_001819 [Taiwanofungus camphoratus]|nr:hypothetical protein AcV5_001819 [Antrodia cinnamomea]